MLSGAAIDVQVVAMSWSWAILYAAVFLPLNLWVLHWVTKVEIRTVLSTSAPSFFAALAAFGVGFGTATALDGLVRRWCAWR